MIDRDAVIATAREAIGTPFQHQGRAPGVGLDCSGLVLCALQGGGWTPKAPELTLRTDYKRRPEAFGFVSALEAEGTRLPGSPEEALRKVEVTDVLFFRYEGEVAPRHVALVSQVNREAGSEIGDWVDRGGISIIHTGSGGVVCEHALDATWRNRVVLIYRIKD